MINQNLVFILTEPTGKAHVNIQKMDEPGRLRTSETWKFRQFLRQMIRLPFYVK